ncbi:hypothetical protein [Gloeocapsopsis dulcis]|uniref:Uncharacterized protein n=1 Tax=Gloeocapsopsis dulcis AAB1 = 1H9 TaxID=1433147 RepID=A0A6N8FSN9_9CHRO|nr:hypothetical protein [Gloeocapsopsis dulcis]MUL36113.1 hypothetical protein [Gloeocapsopsis dulcis AAB1 = 1H9]WNN91415.1 hypothetical protein P0S91_10230 [Gloeocapsopsis dulcis]
MLNFPHPASYKYTDAVVQSDKQPRSLAQSQESIYSFLLENIKQHSAETVLQHFIDLFILPPKINKLDHLQAIQEIITSNNKEEFHNTIKRCCYILLNNWKLTKKTRYIEYLIAIFENLSDNQPVILPTQNPLRIWVEDFISSESYIEVKAFADKCQKQQQTRRHQSYTSHTLIAQSNDIRKPIEQREAARNEASRLKYQFKFDLAMYMASSQSSNIDKHKNPTNLPEEVLRLIKLIVAKRDPASYASTANLFLKQTKNLNYRQFKERLEKFLVHSSNNSEVGDTSRINLSKKLITLNVNSNEKEVTDALVLRTCNTVIEYLTTENHHEPSPMFLNLISQGNPLTLVMLLIKILLICKGCRIHLETCIAELIRYYEKFSEKERDKMNTFLDIFNVMCAIYIDNIPVKLN